MVENILIELNKKENYVLYVTDDFLRINSLRKLHFKSHREEIESSILYQTRGQNFPPYLRWFFTAR